MMRRKKENAGKKVTRRNAILYIYRAHGSPKLFKEAFLLNAPT